MSEQGFRGVPGVPDGWELVAIRKIKRGDWTIDICGEAWLFESVETLTMWPVIRKIEEPAKYRPFASAEEFKPHRDRWWYRDGDAGRMWFPPQYYADNLHGGVTFQYRFETSFFDDGTPFGVRLDD